MIERERENGSTVSKEPKASNITKKELHSSIYGNLPCTVESFRFDYEYDYDYEIRHFWGQLLASSRADVIKS